MHRKSETDLSRSRYTANETLTGGFIVCSGKAAPQWALTGAALGRRRVLAEFRCTRGDACVAVQQKDTAHVEHLTHGAKRHEAQSIAQWCLRSCRDCHAVTEYHTVGWKTSADHAVAELSRPDREDSQIYFSAEHVKVKQRAKETQGSRTTQWCWRSYREQRPHTVALKAPARLVPHKEENYQTAEYECICCEPTITQKRSTTQCWRCQRSPRSGKRPQKREPQTGKQLSAIAWC